MTDYVDNFLAAVDNPLPALQETFQREEAFLTRYVNQGDAVLALGLESGRATPQLVDAAASVTVVDDSETGADCLRRRLTDEPGVTVQRMDFTDLGMETNQFDLVYTSYNVVGTVSDEVRSLMIGEMQRVAKPEARIVNMTWKRDAATTSFLKQYYPEIGISVKKINASRAITEKGVFRRVSEDELVDLYSAAAIDNVLFENIDPLWHAAVGVKP